MGFERMQPEKVFDIYRRWQAGQRISHIAALCAVDRKTVRKYIAAFANTGLTREQPIDDAVRSALAGLTLRVNARVCRKQKDAFLPYKDEIIGYITKLRDAVNPKTAYEIVRDKYAIAASYSSFKRFIRREKIVESERDAMVRIEMPPGLQVQIDYCKVGSIEERPGVNKTVYAFVGILSCSRLPYIEFVFKQDTAGFATSNVNMWEYYGGVTETVALDNLKAGVLKPSLYDPVMNKTYAEVLAYYGTFGDTCRVATATDKGKIERFVQPARELYRKLRIEHPEAGVPQLNAMARSWCLIEYGMRVHGTTKLRPKEVFEQVEKSVLKKLPESRMEIPKWHCARVHPDQFIQFEKKSYSVPPEYRGKDVWVRKCGNYIRIHHNSACIKTYRIPTTYRAYDDNHFPEHTRTMLDGGMPAYLIKQAGQISETAKTYITEILRPHAFLNLRKAQGVLGAINEYLTYARRDEVLLAAMRERVRTGGALKDMFEADKSQPRLFEETPCVVRSTLGESMVRPSDYFTNKEVPRWNDITLN